MHTDFEFTCQPPSGHLRIVGDLDGTTVDHLADVLDVMTLRGCTHVVVDLEEVTYLDARNLHVLHEVHQRLLVGGVGLRLDGANEYHRLVARHEGYWELFADPTAGTTRNGPPATGPLDPIGGLRRHDPTDLDGASDARRT